MNRQRRGVCGVMVVGLVTMLAGLPAHAQSRPDNPLRKARTASNPEAVESSRPIAALPATPAARPAAVQPAAFELASQPRSIITSPQRTLSTQSSMSPQITISRQNTMPPQGSLPPSSVIGREMLQGDVIYEGPMMYDEGGKGGFAGDACCGGGGCATCCVIPCPRICLDNFEVFAGVQGFTGPVNRGQTGSFGFHEGFNWGAPLPCFGGGGLGAQFGLQATQSNLSGAEFTDETRHQLFMTGGLFRRVDWGLQGGVVVDYLSDDWYAASELVQLRGEISWVFPCTHELGFWMATRLQEDTTLSTFSGGVPAVNETFESTDLYAFFYRHHFAAVEGASCRIFAGFTGESDGLIGLDMRIPLSCDWALQGEFTYLVPEQASGTVGRGHAEESWNIAMNVVWYPGARTAGGPDYFRPLFNVANNGSFMVGRR